MTTIRINLLPHREMQRAQQQKAFVAMLVAALLAGLAVVGAGHMILTNKQEAQEARNALLRGEIAKLEAQMKEIAVLKDKTNSLLARKKVVEDLQSNRSESVRLFSEMARLIPDGLYLRSLKQTDKRLDLNGYTQSSARVSTYMRSLEGSDWFATPQLIEVKAASVGNLRVQEFSLVVQQTSPKVDEAADNPKAQ